MQNSPTGLHRVGLFRFSVRTRAAEAAPIRCRSDNVPCTLPSVYPEAIVLLVVRIAEAENLPGFPVLANVVVDDSNQRVD